jgi:hypothetical protein
MRRRRGQAGPSGSDATGERKAVKWKREEEEMWKEEEWEEGRAEDAGIEQIEKSLWVED